MWKSILEGTAQQNGWNAINAIIANLDPLLKDVGPSLAGGHAGVAMLFHYLALAEGSSDYTLRDSYLTKTANELQVGDPGISLFGGISGVAFALEHILGNQEEDPNEDIDQALLDALKEPNWPLEYDLVSGLVGVGVYALERLPRPSAVACLEHVVARLEELGVRSEGGITWFTPPEFVPSNQNYPNGYYNVGLAHGVSGVVGLLGRVCTAKVAFTPGRELLEGAVSWLLRQRLENQTCQLPSYVGEGIVPSPSRSAWCYGDPGGASALWIAAEATHNADWKMAAIEMARMAAQRPSDQVGANEPGLCHGAVGLAHVYNRIYQVSGDEVLLVAARKYFENTMAMRIAEAPLGGFRAVNSFTRLPDDLPGLLEGAVGVALALLAGVSSIEPKWDRVLMLPQLADA